MKKRLQIALLALLSVALLIIGYQQFNKWSERARQNQPYSSLFGEVLAIVKSDYLLEIDPESKTPAAFRAMISSLDAESAYLNPGQHRSYHLLLKNEACQPGIFGRMHGYRFVITSISENSPAEQAGLAPGDAIIAVNQQPLVSHSAGNVLLQLATPQPTDLRLTIRKKDSDKSRDILLSLAKPQRSPLIVELGRNLYRLQLNRIQSATVTALENFFQAKKDLQLLIDLRHYECGDLDSFLRLTRLFIPPENGLSLKTKLGFSPIACGSPQPCAYRGAVIVDESTCSYAELLAILLHKHRLPVVGHSTAGSIAKVDIYPLEEGSALLLTSGFFYLDGRNLYGRPLSPDQEIPSRDWQAIQAGAVKRLQPHDA